MLSQEGVELVVADHAGVAVGGLRFLVGLGARLVRLVWGVWGFRRGGGALVGTRVCGWPRRGALRFAGGIV